MRTARSVFRLSALLVLLGACDGRDVTQDSGARPDSGPPRHKGVLVRWTIEGSNAPALCQTFKIARFFYGMALYRCPAGNQDHTDSLGFVECSEEWEAYLGTDFCRS